MVEIVTKSAAETKRVARIFVREASRHHSASAFIIVLEGELGAGKTTFAQGFADALGVKERVLSPTFVLMKIYGLRPRIKDKRKKTKGEERKFKHLVHIDCYRIQSPKELLHLGLKDILKDRDAIILIEWADRIKKILPSDAIWFKFSHGAKQNERRIIMSEDVGEYIAAV